MLLHFQLGLVDELANNSAEAMAKATGFLNTFKNMSPYARSATKLMLRNRDIEDMKRYREDVSGAGFEKI